MGTPCSDEKKEKLRLSNLGKKHNISPEGLEKIKKNLPSGWNKGKPMTSEWKEKLRKANLGKKASLETRKKMNISRSGERNPNWIKDRKKLKGTLSEERRCSAYVIWRKEILKRDNYKCRMNNKDCLGKICVHHILSFTKFANLRHEIKNGITLCRFHHPRKRMDEQKMISVFTNIINSQIN